MRVFSPQGEIHFAGHPIIATAFVLSSCGEITLTQKITPIIFEQNTGAVEVNITAQNEEPIFVQFTRKVTSSIDRFTPSDEELAHFLTLDVSELDHNKYAPRLVFSDMAYLVIPVWKYESVRHAKFNYAAWNQSSAPQTSAQEILLFSPKTPFGDSDFNVRLLGSRIGIHDDPPVGSAMPAFTSYLCSFEFMQKGTYTFSVDRGDENTRRSVLHLEMDYKGEDALTIRVGGNAVMVAQGTMNIPDL
jgi:trans-2,3-dihydro-3-hydroxyanthranilate isomerase